MQASERYRAAAVMLLRCEDEDALGCVSNGSCSPASSSRGESCRCFPFKTEADMTAEAQKQGDGGALRSPWRPTSTFLIHRQTLLQPPLTKHPLQMAAHSKSSDSAVNFALMSSLLPQVEAILTSCKTTETQPAPDMSQLASMASDFCKPALSALLTFALTGYKAAANDI